MELNIDIIKEQEKAHRRRAAGDHPPPGEGDAGRQQDAGIRIRGFAERSDYRTEEARVSPALD